MAGPRSNPRSKLSDPGSVEALVCDLDGVVYRGPTAVPHAVEVLSRIDVPVIYATNNASRAPDEVVAHLRELGLSVSADQVVTSAQAGAAVLAERLPGARVLAVGGDGVGLALEEAGLVAVPTADRVEAVLQGYGPGVRASDLAEAAYAVAAGAWWVATNTDATIPNERGIAPGNGALVGAVERAVGRAPDRVVGKPHPDLYVVAAARLGVPPERILAVGDRLDTDIEGAVTAGLPSVLVLTGVDSRDRGEQAPANRRPDKIIEDLRGLRGLVPMSEDAPLL
ncbi:MAG: HAD-IIA family hydrolase [Dermatophilaceae bacterium]|nr:HAD-IIA family hydrolase [Intrasporangiaceae bacterium]